MKEFIRDFIKVNEHLQADDKFICLIIPIKSILRIQDATDDEVRDYTYGDVTEERKKVKSIIEFKGLNKTNMCICLESTQEIWEMLNG